jgi:phage terminase large subunit-like protein
MAMVKEDLVDIVVGVDPAIGGPCETGIVCVGKGQSGHLYLLADRTCRGSPAEWCATVVSLAKELKARIVCEANQGGNMCSTLILHANPAAEVSLVHAGSSKAVRAEPVAALAERGLLHHVGEYLELEDQLVTWSPGEQSPDRLDAFVHAAMALMSGGTSSPQVAGSMPMEMGEEVWNNL